MSELFMYGLNLFFFKVWSVLNLIASQLLCSLILF